MQARALKQIRFQNEILEIGYPRNDVFYNVENTDMTEKKKLIKQKLGIESNKNHFIRTDF